MATVAGNRAAGRQARYWSRNRESLHLMQKNKAEKELTGNDKGF